MSGSARTTILGLVLAATLVFAVSATQAAPPSGGCITVATTTTCTFNYTGAPEAWVVPAGVTSGVFDVFGAQGGNLASGTFIQTSLPGGSGGMGGRVQATVALTPGTTLNMRVGGKGDNGIYAPPPFTGTATAAGGFNGGGTNTGTCASCGFVLGAAGGGSSDVRTSADALASRLLVAGGGGGAGVGGGNTADPGTGGNSATGAKSATGQNPQVGPISCPGGGAGTLIGPGAAGGGGCFSGSPGDPLGLLGGGTSNLQFLGAGGGGLYGGGAGAAVGPVGTGGGGGSDYPNPLSPPAGITNVTITDGVHTGNGLITVTYTTPVFDPEQAITDLKDTVSGMGLRKGLTTALNAKLNAALKALDADDHAGACTALQDFQNLVNAQTGKKLSAGQAEDLTDAARQIFEQVCFT